MASNPKHSNDNASEAYQHAVRTIPVIEETAVIDKLKTVTGKVTVLVEPRTETEQHSVALNRVSYREHRVAKDEVVEQVPDVRHEGDVTIIPVVNEEVVLVKRLRLVEEIHLTKEETTEHVTKTIDLRKDHVSIVRE